jgi:hypothetical protein
MSNENKPTLRGAISTNESKLAAGGAQKYWSSVWVDISIRPTSPREEEDDNAHFAVELHHDPEYKLGARYLGKLMIAGVTAIAEAVAVCSFGGGRGWAAWEEDLEERVRSIRQEGLPNPILLNGGDYLFIIYMIEDH